MFAMLCGQKHPLLSLSGVLPVGFLGSLLLFPLTLSIHFPTLFLSSSLLPDPYVFLTSPLFSPYLPPPHTLTLTQTSVVPILAIFWFSLTNFNMTLMLQQQQLIQTAYTMYFSCNNSFNSHNPKRSYYSYNSLYRWNHEIQRD